MANTTAEQSATDFRASGNRSRRWLCAAWGLMGWGVLEVVHQLRPDWLLTWFCHPAGRFAGWFFTTSSSLTEDRILVLHHSLMDLRITPACSGFSFFILLVLSLGWHGWSRKSGIVISVILLGLIPCAYGLTLITNMVRLILSVYGRAFCDRFLLPEMADAIHLASGIVTFLPVLILTYLLMERTCNHAVRRT